MVVSQKFEKQKNEEMKKKQNLLLLLAVLLFLWFSIDILIQTWWSAHIDFDSASKYGTLLGGIFSFISVLLIYLTLRKQSEIYDQTSFENRFFELVKFHRENVNEWSYTTSRINEKTTEKGQKVFIEIFREFLKAQENLDQFLKKNKKFTFSKILNENGKDYYSNNYSIKERNIEIETLIKIDIAYLIVFFGVYSEGKSAIKKVLSKKYNEDFVNILLTYFESIKSKWNSSYVYFGGHQHRLGHYFRHLYQSINYVNSYSLFYGKYNVKYDYTKLYRAQFSTYEQAIILFNSLSEIGKEWEFSTTDINKMLITKFNLVKNIPAEFIVDMDVRKFYPNIVVEGEIKTNERIELEKEYK